MDKYLNDYLKMRRSFTPPSESFKPSFEETPEILYESPLVHAETARKGDEPIFHRRQESHDRSYDPPLHAVGNHYILDKEGQMYKQIISQMLDAEDGSKQ